MIKVVSFDLDGTIVPGTTTGRFIARRLGHGTTMDALEEAYTRGEITNRVVADRDGRYYHGKDKARIHELLRTAPVISGLRPTIAALKEAGIHVILGTITWRFIAEYYMNEYGFLAASGVEMEETSEGSLTGRVTRYFDETDKVEFVASFCAARGIPISECAAVGDSRSDISLFKAAGLAIAFNATEQAKAYASVHLDAADLASILPYILPRT